MSSVRCNDRPTEPGPSRAGPNRLSTTTAGSDTRKQSLTDNTYRLDTEEYFRTDPSYQPELRAYLARHLGMPAIRASAQEEPA